MPSQMFLNQRGYAFSLPSLGLPDLGGEWVNISAAIGFKDQCIAFLERGGFTEPRHHACDRDAVVAVSFEGAAWLLPLCAPQTPATETAESFTLKVRRQRLPRTESEESKVIKLPDGLALWFVSHPKGLRSFKPPQQHEGKGSAAATLPTGADEEVFWQELLQQKNDGSGMSISSFLSTNLDKISSTSHPAAWQVCKDKRHDPRLMNWDHSPKDALSMAWQLEALTDALLEAHKSSKMPKPSEIVYPVLRVRAQTETDNTITFMHATTFGENAPPPTDEQWRPIPRGAWKPGYELSFVNQVREAQGLKPLKENELHLARSSSSL